jgi:16S rRNA (guanine1207-N2)-methyltransferase
MNAGAAAAPVLAALFLPFESGELSWPARGDALFLGARAGTWLHERPRGRILCEQGFRPFAQALEHAGARVGEATDADRYPLVLVLPPRQRDEARALFARALRHAGADGVVLAAMANDEGARSGETDLGRLCGGVQHRSRHKCRAFWSVPAGRAVDAALCAEWSALDALRPVAGGPWLSRPGLFSWDRIDAGSALLARHLPATLHGRVADLGAGWGWLSTEVLRRCDGVQAIDLYEADRRALEPARINAARAADGSGRAVDVDVLWHDVAAGLPRRYDAIVSNPPFHQGRAADPALGRAFIAAAAGALAPGGVFLMVANRHLPYEAELARRFACVREVAAGDGFKLLEAREPRR